MIRSSVSVNHAHTFSSPLPRHYPHLVHSLTLRTQHTHICSAEQKQIEKKKRSNENKFVWFAFDLSHSLRVLRNSSETILLHFVLNKYIQMWWFRFLLNQLQLHFHTVRLFTSDRWNVHTRHNNCLVFRYVDFETNVSKHSAVHIHSLVIFKEKFNTIDNINNKLLRMQS